MYRPTWLFKEKQGEPLFLQVADTSVYPRGLKFDTVFSRKLKIERT